MANGIDNYQDLQKSCIFYDTDDQPLGYAYLNKDQRWRVFNNHGDYLFATHSLQACQLRMRAIRHVKV